MSEKDRSGYANYASQPSKDWVMSLLANRQLDDAMADSVSPLDVAVESAMTGTPVSEILDGQYDTDEGILLKNELLVLLLDHAERRSLHIDDFLALLERQARGTVAEQETRYRQFMGLLDMLTIVARNEELLHALRKLEPEISSEE